MIVFMIQILSFSVDQHICEIRLLRQELDLISNARTLLKEVFLLSLLLLPASASFLRVGPRKTFLGIFSAPDKPMLSCL